MWGWPRWGRGLTENEMIPAAPHRCGTAGRYWHCAQTVVEINVGVASSAPTRRKGRSPIRRCAARCIVVWPQGAVAWTSPFTSRPKTERWWWIALTCKIKVCLHFVSCRERALSCSVYLVETHLTSWNASAVLMQGACRTAHVQYCCDVVAWKNDAPSGAPQGPYGVTGTLKLLLWAWPEVGGAVVSEAKEGEEETVVASWWWFHSFLVWGVKGAGLSPLYPLPHQSCNDVRDCGGALMLPWYPRVRVGNWSENS